MDSKDERARCLVVWIRASGVVGVRETLDDMERRVDRKVCRICSLPLLLLLVVAMLEWELMPSAAFVRDTPDGGNDRGWGGRDVPMPSSSSRCSRAAIRRSRLDGAGVGLNTGAAVAVAVAAASAPAEATTGRGNGGAGLAHADADTTAETGIAVGVGWRDADAGASAAAEELSPANEWLVPVSAAMVSGGSVGAAVAAPQVTILLCCCLLAWFALLKNDDGPRRLV